MFKDASSIESVVWDMKLADLPRSSNRARINELFNGEPPYTFEEQQQNNINTNVNWLDATKIAHDARQQFSQAFMSPGNYFRVTVDRGPAHRRQEWSEVITSAINRRMKKSLRYHETLRNVFAQVVLHGIGPVTWPDRQRWVPEMHMMGDVLMPGRTLLTMDNTQHFAIFRRYTAAQLVKATAGKHRDPGWNMTVVNACLEWAAKQRGKTNSSNDQIYSPEKIAEDIKADQGLYGSDVVPTIDCWDFYFLSDEKKNFGWQRRIVLDTPTPSDANAQSKKVVAKNIVDKNGQYLYSSGKRTYGRKLGEIIHHQYADGSVVAPFRYHSVRSLGFLLYAVCHLQNRLRCKLNDNAFEDLMQYFRVANPDDMARLQKVDLINWGIIPEGLNFVRKEERWQTNQALVQTVMNYNRQTIAEHGTSYTKDSGLDPNRKNPDKTATQVAAEVNASTAMVGAMLNDAYNYQDFQYAEICRRFCIKNSVDLDVREFRKECLKAGVPDHILDSECWRIAAERVIGNGNKQVQRAQIERLMQQINRYDPDAQRIILREYTFANTDNPDLTKLLVPEEKTLVTDSVHDAQMSAAAMLMGLPMGLKQGVNHGEYAATLLGMLQSKVQEIMQSGGVAPANVLAGMENLAGQTIDGQPVEGNGAMNHINILAQEESSKALVKQLSDALGNMMNEIKGMAQRLAEQEQAQQQQNGGMPPEAAAALKAEMIKAEVKAANSRAAHAQKLQQKTEAHELEMANRIRETQVQEAATDLTTQGKIRREARENMESNGAESVSA